MIYLFIAIAALGFIILIHAVSKIAWGEGFNNYSELLEPWHLLLVGIGLILILVSIILDLLQAPNDFTWASFGRAVLHELAVAVLIAWLVSVGIERVARRKQNLEASVRQQTIAENVVAGVFGVQYPRNYILTVIETHLRPKVVRESYRANYVVRKLSDEEVRRLEVDQDRFVVFRARRSFRLRNVSNHEIEFPVTSCIPVRRAQKLREFAGIRGVVFNGEPIPIADIAKAQDTVQAMDGHLTYRWVRTIAAGGFLDVAFDSIMVKEFSDNEAWASAHPTTDGVEFDVQVVPGMRFGLESISSGKLRRELILQEEGIGTWKLDGFVLPNESVIFWWRSREDDGEDEIQSGGTG